MFNTSYLGLAQMVVLTFLHSGLVKGTDEGKPVKISANGTVALCADGDKPAGFISAIEPDAVSVKMDGCFELVYSGSDPALGSNLFLADGTGKVKTSAGGLEGIVLSRDTTAKTICVLFK